VAELADAHDSKSCSSGVSVRPRPSVSMRRGNSSFLFVRNSIISSVQGVSYSRRERFFSFFNGEIPTRQNHVKSCEQIVSVDCGGVGTVRRKNVLTEDELKVVHKSKKSYASTFGEAVDIFVKDCELRNLRPQTVRFYQQELSAFFSGLREQGIDTEKINPCKFTEEHVKENVILYMRKTKGLRIVSINTRLRALRAFFNFLYKHKHVSNNPMENISLLKDRRRVVATFTKEQLSKLFKQPDLRTFTGLRDYTIMMLFLETGIRVNELTGLTLSDIRWEDNLILIRNAKSYRERQVPMQKRMKEQLKKYIAIRGYVETDALFVTIDQTPLANKGVQERITKYGDLAKIKDVRCSPHTFRHTFAKLSVQQGANIFELQTILGHTSMEIVKVYVNLFGNDVKESHKKFSPLNALKEI
jgi:integrase/recombinase XerD